MLRFNGRSDRVKHRTEVLFISVLQHVLDITVIVMSFLPVMIGVMVGMTFKLTTIQTASVGITAALAVLFVQYIGGRLKEYSILLLPTLSILLPGMAGYLLLPYVKTSTGLLGVAVENVTTLQRVWALQSLAIKQIH